VGLALFNGDRGGRDRMVVASSNPAHVEVYWIQHYVVKFSVTGR